MKNIKYVSWRSGRPRFQPGKSQREKGLKGFDLRHEDGNWFSWQEAEAWSTAFAKEQPAREAEIRPTTSRLQQGYIYFCWAGKRIKIGFSKRPADRLNQIKTGISDPVRLYLAIPGSTEDEKLLHRRLASQRTSGEWFKASTFTLKVMRMMLNESTDLIAKKASVRD